MSRIYVVRAAESTRIVHVADGVQAPLDLLPILAPARMAELLAAELAALGFVRDGDVTRRAGEDGTTVIIDLIAGTVTVEIAAAAEVHAKVEQRRVTSATTRAADGAALETEVAAALDQRLAARAEAVRRDATARLEARLADLRAELDGAIGRATVAALGEKARELGEVETVVADGAGNVTITVRL